MQVEAKNAIHRESHQAGGHGESQQALRHGRAGPGQTERREEGPGQQGEKQRRAR
jgi:hypothetical protein